MLEEPEPNEISIKNHERILGLIEQGSKTVTTAGEGGMAIIYTKGRETLWFECDNDGDITVVLSDGTSWPKGVSVKIASDEERRMEQYGTLHLCEVCTSGPSPYTPKTCPNRKDTSNA